MRAWVVDTVGAPVRLAEVPEPRLTSGGVIIDVLAAHVPGYTDEVADGSRGYVLPTPLVLGPTCVGRVRSVAADVFNVDVGDIVLASSLLSSVDADRPSDEILVGWTGTATERGRRMQAQWRGGVFAECAVVPKETLTRLAGAGGYADYSRLAFLPWLAIAAEALLRAELRAGQTVVVCGATGQLGAATTLVGLAGGAARVVAVGRNPAALDRLAALDERIVPVRLRGDRAVDTAAAVAAAGGRGAHLVADVLGDAPTSDPTRACFDALRADGTMVLVGGLKQHLSLPYGTIMRKRLTVRGSFMFSTDTAARVWNLVAAGLIDLSVLDVTTVALDDPEAAISVARTTSGLALVVLRPSGQTGQGGY